MHLINGGPNVALLCALKREIHAFAVEPGPLGAQGHEIPCPGAGESQVPAPEVACLSLGPTSMKVQAPRLVWEAGL